ncbi:MAG: hypothetical protein H7Z72_26170 [Bacteroidetes bacterium]|nr:hypothetical protein [Fibrella sp.]
MPIANYISVILVSMLKFVGGPLAGVALGLPWPLTVLFTVIGTMSSVVIVIFAGQGLERLMQRYRRARPKLFTRRTRLAIRVWKRSGLFGIALLTPLLLTPIGGTVLAVSFRAGAGRILVYMLISALFWGLVFTLAIYQIPGLSGILKR